MKFIHDILGSPIYFTDDSTGTLVVENPQVFRSIVGTLLGDLQEGENRFFYYSAAPVLTKEIEVIVNPFAMEINRRSLLAKLFGQINRTAVESDNYEFTAHIYSRLQHYLDALLADLSYDLDYTLTLGAGEIFKAANVRFSVSEDLLERITDYLIASSSLLGIKLFVFVNIRSYLTDFEVLSLIKMAGYHKIHLFFLESVQKPKLHEIDEHVLIDFDLCEIRY